MTGVSTCLWYDTQALEAAEFYTSLVPGSAVLHVTSYGEGAPLPAGTPMLVRFRLKDQQFAALNGGPMFTHSPAASVVLTCETQGEIDRLWDALTADGGQPSQCGWLTDRYGLSWQILPAVFDRWMSSGENERLGRVMAAIMAMSRIDLPILERAWAGESVPA